MFSLLLLMVFTKLLPSWWERALKSSYSGVERALNSSHRGVERALKSSHRGVERAQKFRRLQMLAHFTINPSKKFNGEVVCFKMVGHTNVVKIGLASAALFESEGKLRET